MLGHLPEAFRVADSSSLCARNLKRDQRRRLIGLRQGPGTGFVDVRRRFSEREQSVELTRRMRRCFERVSEHRHEVVTIKIIAD